MGASSQISVSRELEIVHTALAGVRILATELRLDHVAYPGDRQSVIASIEAMTVLLGARLKLLERACTGCVDPALLAVPQNIGLDDSGDIVLSRWAAEQVNSHVETEGDGDLPYLEEKELTIRAVTQHSSMKEALKILRATVSCASDTEFTLADEAEIIWRSVQKAV